MPRTLFATVALCAVALPALPAVASAETPDDDRRYGSRLLEEDLNGRDVRIAQRLLEETGESVSADGEYGPGTARAAKSFERAKGLKVDGRLTRAEQGTLHAAVHSPGADEGAAAAGTDTPELVTKARVNADGTATAPTDAPAEVQEIIAAGNEIATKPYRLGGGHGRLRDSAYDCSGSVSYVLRMAGLLKASRASGGFMSWGQSGKGEWITVHAKGSHMYLVVAGIRFDTVALKGSGQSRWNRVARSPEGGPYAVRHPAGL